MSGTLEALLDAVISPTDDKRTLFLQGPAGTGKTTLAVQRLVRFLQRGVPAESILICVPQRVLAQPYYDALDAYDGPMGEVSIATVGGLARRMIALFWPLIAEHAGFAHPEREPIFLTLETTQYYMDRVVGPYLEAGYFDGLSIRRNRLASQIIDNLNKAAVVGFPHTEVSSRLKKAWDGEVGRERTYGYAQQCVNAFRDFCLGHNLLDFSLQYEVFFRHCLSEPLCRDALFKRHRHLIVDNVEEDTPRAHDLYKAWLRECETALLVADTEAGNRAFLGADPQGAAELKWLCQDWLTLDESYVMSPEIEALGYQLVEALGREVGDQLLPSPRLRSSTAANPRQALSFDPVHFQPQMFEWVADQVAALIHEQGVVPSEIAILAPYLGDALRFALSEVLSRRDIPVRSHRPSRALREEPATRCLLTLAMVAHSGWGRCPDPADVAYALMVAIEGLDLVRARLLTEIVYRPREGKPAWSSFDQIQADTQQRITYTLGERFEDLRRWMSHYEASGSLELDDWISQLFADVLSKPGFGFHQDLDGGRVVANLIESIQKFRRAVAGTLSNEASEGDGAVSGSSQEYVRMVEQGVIAATYVENWQMDVADSVLVAPAYTFLMANRPVDVQFWLNIGSGGWWERLYQPLTHPYVLSRQWPDDEVWSDEREFAARQMALGRLILGLVRRCRKQIYLGIAELGEQGYEQRGPLLQAVQRVLRRADT